MSRLNVRSQGQLMSPGTCALCGNGTRDSGYVDLGIFLEFLGNVYLCIDPCVRALSEVAGFVDTADVKLTIEQANAIASENEKLKEENENVNRLNVALSDVLRLAFGISPDSNVVPSVETVPADPSGEADSEGDSVSDAGSDESVTDESDGRESEAEELVPFKRKGSNKPR